MSDFEKEWDKMLKGERYDAANPRFLDLLMETREKLWEFNHLRPSETARMQEILHDLFGSMGENVQVNQPFRCDYGCNMHVGSNVVFNFNLTVLDEGEVHIGDYVLIGPNVSIYTACHPLEPDERKKFVEWAEGVTIGNNVWIGGSAVILPGVTIGDNAVIGAGSVVSRDVPAGTVVVGNPARVVKKMLNNR